MSSTSQSTNPLLWAQAQMAMSKIAANWSPEEVTRFGQASQLQFKEMSDYLAGEVDIVRFSELKIVTTPESECRLGNLFGDTNVWIDHLVTEILFAGVNKRKVKVSPLSVKTFKLLRQSYDWRLKKFMEGRQWFTDASPKDLLRTIGALVQHDPIFRHQTNIFPFWRYDKPEDNRAHYVEVSYYRRDSAVAKRYHDNQATWRITMTDGEMFERPVPFLKGNRLITSNKKLPKA